MKYFNGNRLKLLMNTLDISANDLVITLASKGIKTSVQSIYAWQQGACPRLKTALTLCDVLGANIRDFLK